MSRAAISSISPFFIVADVTATLSFYRDMLGFEVAFRGPTPDDEFFGIVRRDGAMIMFKALGAISDGKEVAVEPVPNYGREPAFSWDAYLEVPDPDALATEFASRGSRASRYKRRRANTGGLPNTPEWYTAPPGVRLRINFFVRPR